MEFSDTVYIGDRFCVGFCARLSWLLIWGNFSGFSLLNYWDWLLCCAVAFVVCLWHWVYSPIQLGLSFCSFCCLFGDFAPFFLELALAAEAVPFTPQHNLGRVFFGLMLFEEICFFLKIWIFFPPIQLGAFFGLAVVQYSQPFSFFCFCFLVVQHTHNLTRLAVSSG